MRTIKSFVSAGVVDDHGDRVHAACQKMHAEVDQEATFNRLYWRWTAAILSTIVVGGGAVLCYGISQLPY